MYSDDPYLRATAAASPATRSDRAESARGAETGTGVSERTQHDEALQHAEELNRRFVESTGDCVKILALDGTLLYMNPVGARMLELPDTSALLHRQITGFFEGTVRQAAEEAIAVARSGGRGTFQYSMRTAGGRLTWWDAVITPLTDATGAVVRLLAISRDVTEREWEEAFRSGQHRTLEMIATGASLPDVLDSVVRLVERQSDDMLCTILLLDEDGRTIRHGAAPSLPSAFTQAIDGASIGPAAGSCGTAMYRGTRVIATDILTDPLWENYRWVAQQVGVRACWSTPIFSPQRRVLGALAMYYRAPRGPSDRDLRLIETAADIARIAIEQQRAQQALRHSEARNQAILRAIPDWMFLTTVDGLFLDFHARDASRLHAAPPDFLGKQIRDVLPPRIADALRQAFTRVMVSDEMEKIEYALAHGDDERFYEACIVRCDGDKILSIVRDITERRRAELELDTHRRELAHLGRVTMLGEMTGTLAHELSQPLTAVLTNAQAVRRLLDRPPLDVDELRSALDDIIRNDQRAGAVIERLRALLRKGETSVHRLDVNELTREVVDLAYGELTSRRILVQSQFAPDIPFVLGDRVQLQQVVLNLVLNACDAMNGTPTAQRHLTLATNSDGEGVHIVVSDHGSGIPDGQLERVFEPFVTFREQGLGLGLAITRSIVTAHGGAIVAENNAGGGATFRCRLPLAPPADTIAAGHSAGRASTHD